MSRRGIARFRYTAKYKHWTLYWSDRNQHRHRYDLIAPACDVRALLDEFDHDPHASWRPHPLAPRRAFRAAVAKLLGRSRTQIDAAVVGEAALIDAPGHQGGQVRAGASTVLACSSSEAYSDAPGHQGRQVGAGASTVLACSSSEAS